MRRGFKKWAENLALEQRQILRLRAEAPLPARLLASHLGVSIVGPREIPGISPKILHHLLYTDRESWSATTLSFNRRIIIVHNTVHSPRRQESDLMHELAHLLCKHQPSQLIQSDNLPFPLRSYDANQEEEARWLGGCLQLPRIALLWAIRRGMDNAMIVEHFGASIDLVRFRRQMTGVDKQVGSRRARG